jgi:hypothetical protein
MRIRVNFMFRDTWSVHCVAADGKTPISQWLTIRKDETLLRLLVASGATPEQMEEVERDMKQRGGGSTLIEVNETGRQLLRIG